LLLSGFFVTISHYSLCYYENKFVEPVNLICVFPIFYYTISYFSLCAISLIITIALAIEFTILQWFEYNEAFFCINDGIYGTTFYLTTGFHGLHVIIGTIFLIIAFFRLILGHFTANHHFGFEASIRY
jgi:Cytochrome c oxidase subunit III